MADCEVCYSPLTESGRKPSPAARQNGVLKAERPGRLSFDDKESSLAVMKNTQS